MKETNLITVEVKVEDVNVLQMLRDVSAMTWEGLNINEENLRAALNEVGTDNTVIYIIKGSVMNEVYELKGKEAYPAELNIVSMTNTKGLAMNVAARWFDDILDNIEYRKESK